MIFIYTDGSANNKTKVAGGCGIVIKTKTEEKLISLGQFVNTTSARMEIKAIVEALKLLPHYNEEVIIYSDNEYCVKTWMQKWYVKWESENWENRKNADLWKEFLIEARKFRFPEMLTLHHIKGHAGNKYNEICDQLASQGGQALTTTKDLEDDIQSNNSNFFLDLPSDLDYNWK